MSTRCKYPITAVNTFRPTLPELIVWHRDHARLCSCPLIPTRIISYLSLPSYVFEQTGVIEKFPGVGGWWYVKIDKKYTNGLLSCHRFGYIPALVTIGNRSYPTWLLPIKEKQFFLIETV